MKYLLSLALSLLLIAGFVPRAGAVDADADANPTIRADGTVVFVVKGAPPSSTKEAALEAALLEGQRRIGDYLSHRGHSFAYSPSIEFIKANMLKKPVYSSIPLDGTGSSHPEFGDAYEATITLEMSREFEKKFRSVGRVTSGLWGLGCAIAALLVIGAFFRLDEWTKGFLTNWLMVGAAGAIAGLAVFFARITLSLGL